MTDRDRLIELLEQANFDFSEECVACLEDGYKAMPMLEDFFADYLLANGVIVPPLSLNQMVWCKSFDGINQCKVSSLTQKSDGSFKIRLTNLIHKFVFEITPDEIGKTVFLTKEEAEEKLKELGK